ncbi:replication protein A 70 kDa DNA-binding subunit B-like, partial [Aphis craccivora]
FSKNGQTYEKIEIFLIDDSNEKITLTLWNDFATNFMGKLNTKINLRNTKISDYKNQR